MLKMLGAVLAWLAKMLAKPAPGPTALERAAAAETKLATHEANHEAVQSAADARRAADAERVRDPDSLRAPDEFSRT